MSSVNDPSEVDSRNAHEDDAHLEMDHQAAHAGHGHEHGDIMPLFNASHDMVDSFEQDIGASDRSMRQFDTASGTGRTPKRKRGRPKGTTKRYVGATPEERAVLKEKYKSELKEAIDKHRNPSGKVHDDQSRQLLLVAMLQCMLDNPHLSPTAAINEVTKLARVSHCTIKRLYEQWSATGGIRTVKEEGFRKRGAGSERYLRKANKKKETPSAPSSQSTAPSAAVNVPPMAQLHPAASQAPPSSSMPNLAPPIAAGHQYMFAPGSIPPGGAAHYDMSFQMMPVASLAPASSTVTTNAVLAHQGSAFSLFSADGSSAYSGR